MTTNFEPHECVIFVQSTKIRTHENKAIHSSSWAKGNFKNSYNNVNTPWFYNGKLPIINGTICWFFATTACKNYFYVSPWLLLLLVIRILQQDSNSVLCDNITASCVTNSINSASYNVVWNSKQLLFCTIMYGVSIGPCQSLTKVLVTWWSFGPAQYKLLPVRIFS